MPPGESEGAADAAKAEGTVDADNADAVDATDADPVDATDADPVDADNADAVDATDADCPARTYYFDVGPGLWRGPFDVRVTDWRAFLGARLGLLNRLLVVAMAATVGLLGPATITSRVEAHPDRGAAGVATNDIRVAKLGVTLYALDEEYRLEGNCRDVTVVVDERFGPVPGLLENHKEHPAEVVPGPLTRYRVPLLGTEWTGRVEPVAGGDRIEGTFETPWAVVNERLDRVG